MGKKPRYRDIDGLRLPPTFLPEVLREAKAFHPEKGDVVVATYPKCGTTWMLQIVLLILRKGEPPKDGTDYFASLPFLEITEKKNLSNMKRPRCIKTHLQFEQLTISPEAKYIYVARHPADCVVSFYHHTRFFPIYFYSDGNFDDFFDLFVKGEVDFGDYFDHLLSWYERRNEPNVFLITFEALKADTRGSVLRIARFLGEEYHDMLLENNEEVLNKVLEYSSVEFMKSTVNVYWKESFSTIPPEEVQAMSAVMRNYCKILEEAKQEGHESIGDFVRKATAGEGKINLSKEQVEELNARIREKTAHSDVMDLWKNN